VLIALYFWKFYRKWKSKGIDILFVNTLMYIYLSFVVYFTLMPVITSLPFILNHGYHPINFTPFIDVTFGRGDFMRQVGLNIIMTIPFGLLFPLVKSQKTSFFKTLAYTFLLSLTIEIIQPLISDYRIADITDLINNVLGGAIGYALYIALRPLLTAALRRISKLGRPSDQEPFSSTET